MAKPRPLPPGSPGLTAAAFIARLNALQSDDELRKIRRYFKSDAGEYGEGDLFMGVRMGHLFALADEFVDLEPAGIEALLESPIHEIRAGALSIMGKQAARKATPEERRGELFALYLRRHDRINNWDLVDLAAPNVVGLWLLDRPRDILCRLARSEIVWERRTAAYALFTLMRKRGETADAFAIAELLSGDREDLMHKAVGAVLRMCGGHDRPGLVAFLERHAATMPRVMLRTALEHFPPGERTRYLAMGKA
ncbi:MAG: DNA alkylation repair protein [Bauldia sp.]|nr:DNA alkylation repair protein [Bauldia sp.]